MSNINTAVYGSPEQWTHFNTNTASQQYEIKGAYFGDTSTNAFNRNNLTLGVKNGYLSIGNLNIDNSLSVWGVNKNCGLCNISLEAIYDPKEEETQELNPQYEDVPLTVSPVSAKSLFLLGANGVQSYATSIYPTQSWQLYGQNYANVPITSFNYTHTVMMCYLEVCSAVNKSEVTQNPGVKYVALGDYYAVDENNEYTNIINPTTHPAILGGFVVPYYGYPYKAGSTTFYQPRQSLGSSKISFTLFDTFKDFSYLSTPTYIVKWDKEKTYPKPITNARDYGGIGECVCIFGQTIQLTNKTAFKTNATEAIQSVLTSGSWQFNAKVKDKGSLYYYTIVNSNNIFIGIDYSDMTKEEIYKQFAMIGFWFADNTNGAYYAFCGEEIDMYTDVSEEYYDHLFIPEFDTNTITTGNYYKAKDPKAKEQPNYKWGDPHVDNKYNPEYKPGGDTTEYEKKENDRGSLTTTYHNNSSVNGFSAYLLTGRGIQSVKNVINAQLKPPADVTADDWIKLDWYGQDPGSFILATNKFPCETKVQTTSEQIVIGRTRLKTIDGDTPLYGIRAVEQIGEVDFGTLEIKPYYNDFRDYEPYSTYIIHIPYLADYTLDPKIWLNHTCKIKIDFDIVTCNAMVEIWRDSMWYDTIYGTFGSPIPFLTYNAGSFQNAIVNSQANLEASRNAMTQSFLSTAVSVASTGVGIATGNIPMTIGGAIGLVNTITQPFDAYNRFKNAEYNLKHTAPNPTGTSGVGGVTSLITRNNCTLIISRPQPLHYNRSMYGKTVGFACCDTGFLNNYHGLTVCNNVRFNKFSGTKQEFNEIQQILNSGVILP